MRPPLVDIHCHLLAGLDDGPRSLDQALVMCALARSQGVQLMAATAHHSVRWPVMPGQIRQATAELRRALEVSASPVKVFPVA